jgi:chromosome partitioning protein
MTRIIGVLNYKGGTGKTTTVVNLAAGLALRGDRVLCVDLDAQGSLATYMGVSYSHTVTSLLLGQASPRDCVIHIREGMDLIPSDGSLLQAEGSLWRMNNDRAGRRLLSEKIKDLQSDYSYVLLDCSPSISLIGQGVLLCAHEIIVPVSMNYLSMVGVRQVLEAIKIHGNTPEHTVRLSLIVPTFFSAHLRKDREILDALTRLFPGHVSEPIRSNVALSEACSHRTSIYDYAPHSHGAEDYALLVEKVVSYA